MLLKSVILQKITRRKLARFIAQHATSELTLDLGCGDAPYRNYFPNRIGVDLVRTQGVHLIGDAHALPFKDATFPVVLATELLEHCNEPHLVINEIWRVLKPGGKVILTTRFIFPIHEAPNDNWRFTRYGLERLFKGWDDVSIVCETQDFETMSVLIQRMVYQSRFALCDKCIKVVLLAAVLMFRVLRKATRKIFGDVRKSCEVDHILASGYYVVARKPCEN